MTAVEPQHTASVSAQYHSPTTNVASITLAHRFAMLKHHPCSVKALLRCETLKSCIMGELTRICSIDCRYDFFGPQRRNTVPEVIPA